MKRRLERDHHLDQAINRISEIMLEQGVTQAELARRMDSNPNTISAILKLKVDPQFSTILAMLHALNMSIDFRSYALSGTQSVA